MEAIPKKSFMIICKYSIRSFLLFLELESLEPIKLTHSFILGPEAIQRFYVEKVPSTSHKINSFDSQPVLDNFVGGQKTIAVHVAGSVKFANDNRIRPFQQNFLLTAQGTFWKVATDVFRYQERN